MWREAIKKMADVFPQHVLQQAQHYHQQGQVLSLRMSDGLLKARVRGENNQLVDVHLDLKKWPQLTRCGCHKGPYCVHTAACFFVLKAQQGITTVSSSQPLARVAQTRSFNAEDLSWFSHAERENDFFSYHLGVLIDGKSVNLLPVIADLINHWDLKTLDSLSNHRQLALTLPSGDVLHIELSRIKPLLQLMLNYHLNASKKTTHIKLKHYQLLLMMEAEEAMPVTFTQWPGAMEIQQALTALNEPALQQEVQGAPTHLLTTLRPYQQEGLNWLQLLRKYQFGGILADDMGLGKTIQTLAHLQYEKEQHRLKNPSLVIAPTSLIGNWLAEAKRFTPHLRVLVFHGSDRRYDCFEDFDVVLSTYGVAKRDKDYLLAQSFYYLILDEAQYIKNQKTKTTQVVQKIKAKHRLCLTGTPLENHLGELWSLFNVLMPGFLGSNRQFRQLFQYPIEKQGDIGKKQWLARRLKPFMLRRTKRDVIQELPAKTEIIHPVELVGKQRELYEAIRLSMEKKVRDAMKEKGLAKSHMVILDALLKLRQACCDPRLVSFATPVFSTVNSAKLTALMTLLPNLIEEGRRVLLFSQFTSMLALIEEELISAGFDYLKLTGKTQHRQVLVDQFQQGQVPIFLISLKAGGVGLNLTAADTVIHYDPWWNPAMEEQASDRAHRIGQIHPVFVYKLIAQGTVEEAIQHLQERKRRLVESVFSKTSSTEKQVLTEEEVTALFKPLS